MRTEPWIRGEPPTIAGVSPMYCAKESQTTFERRSPILRTIASSTLEEIHGESKAIHRKE
jgi:hypothetical protein